MTKQQAFELAFENMGKKSIPFSAIEGQNRAMEIYAAAFAEWVDGKWFKTTMIDANEKVVWTNVYTDTTTHDIYYTTAELLIEFEKLKDL